MQAFERNEKNLKICKGDKLIGIIEEINESLPLLQNLIAPYKKGNSGK